MPITALLFAYTKMAAPQEKSFSDLQFEKFASIVEVPRSFRRKFIKEPARHKQIYECYKKILSDF